MPKTITLQVREDIYDLFEKAASGERRSVSNFVEHAALQYLTSEFHVSDQEMKEILSNPDLLNALESGLQEVSEGKYTIVA